jgi:hypothetical protein
MLERRLIFNARKFVVESCIYSVDAPFQFRLDMFWRGRFAISSRR